MNKIKTNDVTWRVVDDEVVVLNLETSRYLSLNGTGVALWTAMEDGGATAAELVEVLVAEFDDADRSAVAADVEAFLAECEGFGLIERRE